MNFYIFIQHLFPAGRFPNSATNTNAQPLYATLFDISFKFEYSILTVYNDIKTFYFIAPYFDCDFGFLQQSYTDRFLEKLQDKFSCKKY